MRVYIATSWKNEMIAIWLSCEIRKKGHEVDCFCDSLCPRYVFHWTEFVNKPEELAQYNALSFLHDPRVQRAFREDKKWLDWAQAVVMIHPCGKSAHLEAGYAVGQGKPVLAWGRYPQGEFDVMYGFFRDMFTVDETHKLLADLDHLDRLAKEGA